MIYFIEAVGHDLVKIGYTDRQPTLRLSKMQSDSPTQLRLIGTMQGGEDTEAAVHDEFKTSRVRGEWFRYSDELRTFTDTHAVPHIARIGVVSGNPLKRIRKAVLKISQAEMAELTGTTQASVSRWETGGLEPDRKQMAAIRAAAIGRGVEWHDEWFFHLGDQSASASEVNPNTRSV